MSRRPDPADFRAAASRFLTGVTVVTSMRADGSPVGMTANSFTTVSTRPPTVLISLTRGRTWQAVTDSGLSPTAILIIVIVTVSCLDIASQNIRKRFI